MTESFRIEDWLVEVQLGRLSRGSQVVRLEPQVMKVLAYLASRPGQVISKDELLDQLWRGGIASDAALARCISRIRVAFGDDARQSRIIENIPKIGYRMVADLQRTAPYAESGNKRRWLAAAVIAVSLAIITTGLFVAPTGSDALAAHDHEAVKSYQKGRDQYARYTYPFNQNAIMHFEQALRIDPDFGLAHAGLADALIQEAHYWGGDRAELALQHAERAIELEPDHVDALRALGKALALNGYEERALDAFEKARDIDPDDWASALASANLYFQRLEFDNAEAAYLAALRSAPKLDVAMSNLGYLYLKSGDTEAARQWFDRALELYPLQQQAAPRLAMLEMLTGHPDQADSRCERLVESYPQNYACLQVLAVTSLANGDLEKALGGFERVLDVFPDDRYARLGMAKIFLAQNRRPEAISLVGEVLAMTNAKLANGESEPYDYWLVAGGHAVLGNSADAYEWFDKAAEAGRRFSLWDQADPLFEDLRGDGRFDHYIAATTPARSSASKSSRTD